MPALRGTKARDDGGARRGYHSPNVKPMPPSFPSRRNATHLATGGTGRIACATESQKCQPEASGTRDEKKSKEPATRRRYEMRKAHDEDGARRDYQTLREPRIML
jgi:hypothetical protein